MIQGMDCRGIVECEFTPVNVATSRTLLSGGSQVLTVGHPHWTADLRIETPTKQSFAVWDAYLSSREGDRFPFLLGRTFRRHPRNGPVTDAGVTIAGYSAANSTVTISNAGVYTAKIGDMVSYYTANGGYYLGVITAEAAAVSGTAILPVWPFPLAPHATPKFRRFSAFGEFVLDGKVSKSEGFTPNYIEFSARQLIRTPSDGATALIAPSVDTDAAFLETFEL